MVGPGRMRGNLARHAPEKGMRVFGFTRGGVPSELVEAVLEEVRSPADVKDRLSPPRSVFSYIPAGPAVEETPGDLAEGLDKDVLGDGGLVFYPGFEAGAG